MNFDDRQSFFRDHHARFSPETNRVYKIALNQFFLFCPKDSEDVTVNDIRNWLENMSEKDLKPRSIQLKLTALKSFYKYLMEENKIKKNPTVKIRSPQKEDSLPYYLNKRQIAQLKELTKDCLRDRAIVESLHATGVRISELLNIKLEDIKWDTRQIWIRKGKGNKERFVLFTHECAEHLKMFLKQKKVKSQYLFSNAKGNPISRGLVELKFRKYSEILGFKVTPHTMRHTFAAYLAEKGMNFSYIQELLGHANVNSTRIYTRLMNQARKKQYDRYQ